MVIDPAAWRGRRVFLTGHTGFKGSWLSLWLQSMGAEVTGFALAPATDPSLFALARVGEGMRSVTGDIRDGTALKQALVAARPEVVFHLAAQSLVRYSYDEPVETYATNVMGTVNLLEAVRAAKDVRAAVIVTSDKCYENREWPWAYREDEAMGGHDPYSSSKGCAELVTAAYRRSFFAQGGAAIASARAGNVIGGGDWAADRLIPDIVRAAYAGRSVTIRNPEAIRPWQHVLEPLSGYLLLASRLLEDGPAHAQAWNFGPRDEDCRPVGWIVDRMVKAWGGKLAATIDAGERPHEAKYLKVDSSRAIASLGWRPRWRLGTALDSIVRWHQAHLEGADLRAAVLAQVGEYQATAIPEETP